MSARLLPACLAALVLAGPLPAAPPEGPAKLVTATYQVADLIVPVDRSPKALIPGWRFSPD